MEISEEKEVYFGPYCRKCKYLALDGTEEPCNECMTNFYNMNSHKPVKFVSNDL